MQISLGDRRAAAAAKTHLKFRGLSPAIKLKKKGKIRNTYSRLRVSTSLMQILFHCQQSQSQYVNASKDTRVLQE